jgi:hypothetical protein
MKRALFAVFLTACPGPAPVDGLVDAVDTFPDAEPIAPESECVVTTARDPNDDNAHITPCSETDYIPHPPAGGAHYGQWADFATYADPVPWGFLVHSLEHGAVVLAYSCDDCPEVVAAFESIRADTDDPSCREHPNGNRIIVMRDPSIDVPIAAVAWGHVYRATCLDMESLQAFVDAHYARAPENLCIAGVASPSCD